MREEIAGLEQAALDNLDTWEGNNGMTVYQSATLCYRHDTLIALTLIAKVLNNLDLELIGRR